MAARPSSADQAEIARFARDSRNWWDENGPFRPLHRLNPTRIAYIREKVIERFGSKADLEPFDGLRMLDIGCGGGLTAEPLARLGADVTGADADTQAIEVARAHARASELSINYRDILAEQLREEGEGYDVVLALEIIEHVTEPEAFLADCAALCRPGGLVIVSTLNRTPRSYALGIVAAEYILGWVARGTHRWRKFVRPAELAMSGRAAGLRPIDTTGLVFDPVRNRFELSRTDIAVNYFMTLEKPE